MTCNIFLSCRSGDKEPSKICFNKFGANLSIQTFSKAFLFPNNKRKLKTKFSYYYWAGPWKTTGPRPHSACADRAKGRAAAWLGALAQAILAQLTRAKEPRHCGWALRPHGSATREQGRSSADRCSPAVSPFSGTGGASVHTTPSRTGWEGDVGPAARRTTRPRQRARRRGRRRQAWPLPRRRWPRASTGEVGRLGKASGGGNRRMEA